MSVEEPPIGPPTPEEGDKKPPESEIPQEEQERLRLEREAQNARLQEQQAAIEAADAEKLAQQREKMGLNRAKQILEQYLSYQDTVLSDEQKAGMLEFNRTSESAKRYAESLVDATGREDIESIRDKARQMKEDMLSEAARLGIPVSPYGKSLTWAMHDIGKQNYFFTHPDENNPDYEIGDPLESKEKQTEIVNRQLGWEAYAAFRNDPNYQQKVQDDPKYIEALSLFQKEAKENHTLSSKDLAELGAFLRKIKTEDISEGTEGDNEHGAESGEEKHQKEKHSNDSHGEHDAHEHEKKLSAWQKAAIASGIAVGAGFLGKFILTDIFWWNLAKNLWVDGMAWMKKITGGVLGGGAGGSKPAAKQPSGGGDSHGGGH